jgi:hypothetical protein
VGRAAARGGTAVAGTAATARCSAPAAVSSRGAEGCQRKKKGGRGPRESCAKPKKSRDLSVKQKFPLIYNPNEEKPKIEVGDFFKPYNIALRFKFKNSKYIALHFKF